MRRMPASLALVLAAALSADAPAQQTEAKRAGSGDPLVTNLTIFAGGPSGLWRSPDWGSTWKKVEKKVEKGADPAAIGSVRAILPVGPAVYVAGSGGVLVSDDFGESWTRWPLEASVLSILPSRYPLSDLTVFVGVSDGLLVSPDAGRTFQPAGLRGVAVNRIEWPGPALVVGTSAGVVVSHDMGLTWDAPGEGLPASDVGALALSSYFATDPVLFAGVGEHGVYRSRDGGKTWTPSGLQGSRVVDLVWLGPFLYALTDGGLFRSQDVGDTWGTIGRGLLGTPRRILFPLAPASGAEVFLATDRGIWRSGDGAESFLQVGLVDETVSVLATFPQAAPLSTKDKKKK